MINLLNLSNIPHYGRILNLSMLATQLLLMVVILNMVISHIFYIISITNKVLYQFEKSEQVTTYGEAKQVEITLKQWFELIVSTSQSEQHIDVLILVLGIVLTLILLIAIRYQLIEKNIETIANKGRENQKKNLEKRLMQQLDFAPIVIGEHTAFQHRSLIHPFKKPTLVLSEKESISALSGHLNQTKYIINHELCHQLSWDLSLGYIIKLACITNSLIIATIYAYKFLLVLAFFSFIPILLAYLLTLGVGTLLYRLLMKNYYYFSMFKEHLADDFALHQNQCLKSAEAAINTLPDTISQLHPTKNSRLNFLMTKQSNNPFKLFLILNVTWWLSYQWFTHTQTIVLFTNFWSNFIFIMLNSPLLWFVYHHREPKSNTPLARTFIILLLVLVLITASWEYFLSLYFNPNSSKSFITQFIDSIGLYHFWFLFGLFIARKKTI